jgi:hypothetical protein
MTVPRLRGLSRAAHLALALLVPGCLALSACDGSADGTEEKVIDIDFDSAVDGDLSAVENTGTAPVDIAVVGNVDALTTEEGREGGVALRFPEYGAPGLPVIVTVTSEDGGTLNPGAKPFTIGADLMVDERNEGGVVDDGNNVLQHGLFSDTSQYKLQVDRDRASCRIEGSSGAVVVNDEAELEPDVWYHVECRREPDRVVLTVESLDPDVTYESEVSLEGETGSVAASTAAPVVIGGKFGVNGEVVTSNTDQFNGALDHVFVTIVR